MTKDDAIAEAQQLANSTGVPHDVWEHTGGRVGSQVVPAQGRWIPRSSTVDPPKHGVWTKRQTLRPTLGSRVRRVLGSE